MSDTPNNPRPEYPDIPGDTPEPPPPMSDKDAATLESMARQSLADAGIGVGKQAVPEMDAKELQALAKNSLAEAGIKVGDFQTGPSKSKVEDITVEELNARFADGKLTEKPIEVKQMRELLDRLDDTNELLRQIIGVLQIKQGGE